MAQHIEKTPRDLLFDLYHTYGSDYFSVEDMSLGELQEFQLHCANQIFVNLMPLCATFARTVEQNNFSGARTRGDLVPLLFPHTAYKSYPLHWVEDANYRKLTDWLQAFTAHDLSAVDLDDVSSIDDWIVALDRGSEVRITHTFGTSGKLSFIPRSRLEWARGGATLRQLFRDFHGRGLGPDLKPGDLAVIFPSYRHGANASSRVVDALLDTVAGGEENSLFLHPDERFSADVGSLGGRLARIEEMAAGGGQVVIPEQLLRRRDQLQKAQQRRPEQLERFYRAAAEKFGGQNVYMTMLWPMAIEWAEQGLERGIRGLFGSGSILVTGGGLKGKTYAPGWRERVFEFLGIERCYELYGMTELYPQNMRCEHGNYHIHRLIMPFLLHPETGEEMPRHGEQTGRYAALDLNATSMWGGFVSGDQVTMGGWTAPCACGREGIYVKPDIARYSELQGGSDKISCAGAPEAHENAIRYLLDEAFA